MSDISKEYLLLFNTITDVQEALQGLSAQLATAQQKAEALFLESSVEND